MRSPDPSVLPSQVPLYLRTPARVRETGPDLTLFCGEGPSWNDFTRETLNDLNSAWKLLSLGLTRAARGISSGNVASAALDSYKVPSKTYP